MKVLLVNGSSNQAGSTYTALSEVAHTLQAEGMETEIFQLGPRPISDCTACGTCHRLRNDRCVIEDDCVNDLIIKAAQSDGFVFGTPVYYAHPTGRILSALDRAFFAGGHSFLYKPGFAVAVARRAGTTASLDVMQKYFTISRMPLVPSTYWPMVHGFKPEDIPQDIEGMQTLRNAARNLVWLLRCIEAGRQSGIRPPKPEPGVFTNFIR